MQADLVPISCDVFSKMKEGRFQPHVEPAVWGGQPALSLCMCQLLLPWEEASRLCWDPSGQARWAGCCHRGQMGGLLSMWPAAPCRAVWKLVRTADVRSSLRKCASDSFVNGFARSPGATVLAAVCTEAESRPRSRQPAGWRFPINCRGASRARAVRVGRSSGHAAFPTAAALPGDRA